MIGMSPFVIELKGRKFKEWLLANGWKKMGPLPTFKVDAKPKVDFSKIELKRYKMFDRVKDRMQEGLKIKEEKL